jgi:hypothetical protein
LRVSNNDGADRGLRAGDKWKIRYHSTTPASKLTDMIVLDDVSGFFIFPEPLVTAIVAKQLAKIWIFHFFENGLLSLLERFSWSTL